MAERLGVLLVGFGGPESLGQVPAFVESVLGRRPPPPVTAAAMGRYQAIGGRSPLPAMTRRQAILVAEELSVRGVQAEVQPAMLHAHPTIEEAAEELAAVDGEVVVVSLAPYRCEVSTDAYEEAAARALTERGLAFRLVPDWNLEPGYIAALAETLAVARQQAPVETPVVFTAHSLPSRMIEGGDPYVDQLYATAGRVAERLGLGEWRLAYQSVSAAAREPWLAPSVGETLEMLAVEGASSVLIDPIGFLSDHVETLYDNDIEHRARAEELGLRFYRCRCLNDHPGLIRTLADLVMAAAGGG
jgi:ferrochelatase